MLETRHSLNPNPSAASYNQTANLAGLSGDVKKVCSFDPIKFLFTKNHFMRSCAYGTIKPSSRFYSLSETVLNILCQILKSDSQLQKKLQEQQQWQQQRPLVKACHPHSSNVSIDDHTCARSAYMDRMNMESNLLPPPPPPIFDSGVILEATTPAAISAATATSATSATTAAPRRQLTQLDQEIINQMISMGFTAELAQEAVIRSPADSLEQAVEYCFSHPTSSSNTTTTSTTTESSSNNVNQGTSSSSNLITDQPSISTTSSSNELSTPVIETLSDLHQHIEIDNE